MCTSHKIASEDDSKREFYSVENKQNENKLNLTDLMHVAYRWCVLLIAFTVLFGIVTYAYSRFFIKPTYVSQGNLYVKAMVMQEDEDNITYSQMNANARLASDYVEIIRYESVLNDVAIECKEKYNMDITPGKIASMLKASATTADSALILVSISAEDPITARRVADAVLSVASKRLPEVAQLPGSVSVVEQAKPGVYRKTNPLLHAIIGMIAGFVIGMLLVLFIELMDNRIKQTDDIAQKYNLPVIGVVPNIRESREAGE